MLTKPPLYIYPYAPGHYHDTTDWARDTIPMSQDGIKRHFDVVDNPDAADYFYMGQYHDTQAWLLHPNRFEFFKGRENRHIVDLEGDWRDFDHPDWLADAVITTGHARISSRDKFKRRFVRPVMSPMMMRLVKDPPPYEPPSKRGFWFQGQRDSRGIRERLKQILDASTLSHDFEFTEGWGVYLPTNHPMVQTYERKMKEWSFALCPVGEGPSCRFFEAILYCRIPVLVGDYEPFGNDQSGCFHIRTDMDADWMITFLSSLYVSSNQDTPSIRHFRDTVLLHYFQDPTAYFLEWLNGLEG